jgi:alpha-amylase
LDCTQHVVGSNGTLSVEYSRGGMATVLVPQSVIDGSGICGSSGEDSAKQSQGQLATSSAPSEFGKPMAVLAAFVLSAMGLLTGV